MPSWPIRQVDRNILYNLYWNDNFSLFQIATKFKVTQPTVTQWFKRFKIKTRNNKEAAQIAKKVGRITNKNQFVSGGYMWIYKPDYHRSHKGYTQEHLFIWEQKNKKQLPRGFVIHHKDGNKLNNNLDNLILLSRREHYIIEKKIKYWLKKIKSKEGINSCLFLLQQA